MGSRACTNVLEKRKILSLATIVTPDRTECSLVTIAITVLRLALRRRIVHPTSNMLSFKKL